MNENKYLNDAAKLLTAQSREILALKRDIDKLNGDIDKLNGEIAKLENWLVAVLRWHFSEGGSAPELITDEIKSTVPPSDAPFRVTERNGVTFVFATGAVLR